MALCWVGAFILPVVDAHVRWDSISISSLFSVLYWFCALILILGILDFGSNDDPSFTHSATITNRVNPRQN
jgi:hypothetical protein